MQTGAQGQTNPFVVQQLPEYKSSILSAFPDKKDWLELAKYQSENIFCEKAEKNDIKILMQMAEIYSDQNAESINEGIKCASCGKPASNRCSRCKSVWYCSRECQVEHYKKGGHKAVCKMLSEKKGNNTKQSPAEVLLKKPEEKRDEPQEEKKNPIKVEVLNETNNDEPAKNSDNQVPKETKVEEKVKEESKKPEKEAQAPQNPDPKTVEKPYQEPKNSLEELD